MRGRRYWQLLALSNRPMTQNEIKAWLVLGSGTASTGNTMSAGVLFIRSLWFGQHTVAVLPFEASEPDAGGIAAAFGAAITRKSRTMAEID